MRFLLLLPVCGFAAAACAQTTELPLGSPAYHIIDRLEIKSGEDAPFFSGQKPYTRTSVEQYALRLDSARLLDITGKDRQDLFYLHKDNNLSLAARTEDCPRKDRYIESKRPVLNTFYRTPANFYEANVPHFAFNINPILNLSIGSELGASRIDFNNTRGVNIQAGIDNKVWLWTNLTDNQTRFEGFVTRDIREKRYVPGAGYYKVYNSKVLARGVTDAYDYLNADGGVAVQATQHIKVQLGHGRNFIGEGYRSLFLSDISNNYFYLKLNTRVWKFDYQNIFAELTRDNGGRGLDTLYGKKYMATHHLSFRPTKNLTIGAFETVVFSRPDHFEFQYLNPVIFYRTIESSLGSPDNSLLGFDIKYNLLHRVSLYGQVLLDELKINELIANKGWFGNKYGVQLGAKYIDMLGIDHLDGQLEYNVVRPYTYSHRDAYANYTHYNQPLAHPLGANFQEVVALVRYQPMPKLLLKAKLIAAQTGKDTARVNTAGTLVTYTQNTYGNNPLRPYTDAPNGYGNTIGQGSPSNILTLALIASYQLRHNLFIDFTAISRRENNPLPYYQNTMNYVGVGLRLNAATRSVDY